MPNLIIETFENEKPESTIKIPLLVLKVAEKLIPRKAAQAMENEGVNIHEIIATATTKDVSGRLIEITDHKENERVVISIA